MSKGPTLTGDSCIEITKHKYINIIFDKKDWCNFKGECNLFKVLTNMDDVCLLCKYRKLLDIPEIITKRKKEMYK